MTFDRDEKRISDALDALGFDITTPDLMPGILSKMQPPTVLKPKRRPLRPMILAAALTMLLAVGAFAVSVGGFDWLLEKIEVPFAPGAKETYQSVVSSGLKMSVIAKQSYGDMSVLYVTLEDTEGLGRVSKDTNISFKTNDLTQSRSSSLLYFDSQSGIAAFQLRLGARESFDAQTLKLQADGISYGTRDVGEIEMNIDLAEAVKDGENIGEPYTDRTQTPSESLTIGRVADIEGTNSAWVSSIGVLHGYLTVQVGQPAGIGGYLHYNSLHPYLLDPDGNVVESMPWGTGFSRGEDMQSAPDMSQAAYYFDERYFDVDTENLEGYTLCFKGSAQELLGGDWTFEIDFDSVTEVIDVTADISVNGVQMDGVVLTLHPLGMTLVGNGLVGEDYSLPITADIVIETTGGDIKLGGGSASRAHPEMEFECVWQASSAIDMDSVTAILIGDNRIEIK